MLALSSEPADKVEPYLEQLGVTLRTGANSATSGRFGVKGIPDAALIAPDGTLVWQGHPSSLSDSKIEEVLKDAKKPAEGGFLAFRPTVPAEGALEKAVEATIEGKLKKAYDEARDVVEGGRASEAEKENAKALIAELDQHVDDLMKAGEGALERLMMLDAMLVFETLADELSGTDPGDAAKQRIEQIEKDDRLSAELEAAEAYEKTRERASRLSTAKKRKKYEEFAGKYEGTKAAERALAWVRANS